ncbi:hypothetical protein V2H45_19275 [Tumidithrix elongata RA019]|uniref:Uncharacterized protein n=1 Tax=Tumidithrix elongata BACA0141 TaxID=2716417 RepID=A0AAW9Q4R1_9CYAN|nr:hypothetical protein [Tumidithrix elongata RA019]
MQLDTLYLRQSELIQTQKIVQAIFVGGQSFSVSGEGYSPHGNIYCDRQQIDPWLFPGLEECLIAGLLCNNSKLVKKEKKWMAVGDPNEVAMITLAYKAGLERSQLLEAMPLLDIIISMDGFSGVVTLHKVIPILKRNSKHHHVMYGRSLVDKVLAHCEWMTNLNGQKMWINLPEIEQTIADMKNKGLDPIILTKKYVPPTYDNLSLLDFHSGLIFMGIQGVMELK